MRYRSKCQPTDQLARAKILKHIGLSRGPALPIMTNPASDVPCHIDGAAQTQACKHTSLHQSSCERVLLACSSACMILAATLRVRSSEEEEAAMRWSRKVSSSCSSCGRRSLSLPSKNPFTSSGPPSRPQPPAGPALLPRPTSLTGIS